MRLNDDKSEKSATGSGPIANKVANETYSYKKSASTPLDDTIKKLQEAGITPTPERVASPRIGAAGKSSAGAAVNDNIDAISQRLMGRIERSLDITLEDIADHLVALKKEAKKEGKEFTAQDRREVLREISRAARNPDFPEVKALAEQIRSHRLPEWRPAEIGPEFYFSTPDNIRHLPGAEKFVQKMGERFPDPARANSEDIALAGKKLVAHIQAGFSVDDFDFDAPTVSVRKAEKVSSHDPNAWRVDAENFMKAWRAEAQAQQQAAKQHGGLKARAEQNRAKRDRQMAEILARTSSNSKFMVPPAPPAAPNQDVHEQSASSRMVAAKSRVEETQPIVDNKLAKGDLAVKVADDRGPTVSQPSSTRSEQNLKGVILGASPMSADGLRVNNTEHSVSFVKSIQRQVASMANNLASMIDVAVRVALGFLSGKLGAKGIEHNRVASAGKQGQMAANNNLAETEAKLEAAGVRLDQRRASATPNAAARGINADLVRQDPEFQSAVDALAATNEAKGGARRGNAQQHELGAAQRQQQSSRCR